MVRLARILRDYREAGSVNGLLALWGFANAASLGLMSHRVSPSEQGQLQGINSSFMGLTGIGDLILTATGDLSRNRKVGLALGRGATMEAAVADLGHVAEGVRSAHAVLARARQCHIDMPITEAVCAVIDGALTPSEALHALLARDPKVEAQLS